MHYYPFHLKDYRAATAHLTNEQDLAYRRMLDMYYDLEQPLPADAGWIAKRLRVDEAVVQFVLGDMFDQRDGGWHNQRADEELEKMRQRAERNRENGRRGGRKPSGIPAASQSEPSGNRVGSHWQPTLGTGYMGNGSSVPAEKKAKAKPSPSDDPQFAAFWDAYGKKVGKGHAWKAWQRVPADVDKGEIVAAAKVASDHYAKSKDGRKFQKHPATWLEAMGWEDDLSTTAPKSRFVQVGDPEEDWPV